MKADEVKETLLDYQKKLEGILGRFKRTRDAINIGNSDESYLRKIVIELKDFLEDVFGKQNNYSSNIINYYNNGQANFFNMPSYASVEQIRDVVSAVITRISRNPELLMKTGEKQSRADLKEPAKVTLPWLFHHVSVKVWLGFIVLMVTVVVSSWYAGIRCSQVDWIRKLLPDQYWKYTDKRNPVDNKDTISSAIDGQIELLISAHDKRMDELHADYREQEKQTTDVNNRTFKRRDYKKSAERISKLIEQEEENFQKKIKALRNVK
ncbi:hypothetical protein KA005_34800 [bacterium]|nr:hypothetical protein [bacterium]